MIVLVSFFFVFYFLDHLEAFSQFFGSIHVQLLRDTSTPFVILMASDILCLYWNQFYFMLLILILAVRDQYDRFGASMDEFKEGRTKEEEIAKEGAMDDDGFQLVCGKNKKKSAKEGSVLGSSYSATGVSVATKDRRISGAKPKVPFHIPSIPRPQDEYRIIVNNANLPFQHVWLEQSEDGTRLIHPLVDLSLSLTHGFTLCVYLSSSCMGF